MYKYHKKGNPLVLLHGFCEDSRMWENWSSSLSEEYSLLTVDIAGFGQAQLGQAPFGIEDMAQALLALMQHLDLPPALVVGHSMGGYIALEMARRQPQHLAGLSLLHSHPFGDSEEKQKRRMKTIDFIQRNGLELFAKHFVQSLFAPAFYKAQPELITALEQRVSHYSPHAVFNALRAMAQRPSRADTVQNTLLPLQWIIGEQDLIIPLEQSLEATALNSTARVDRYDIGHLICEEAPALGLEALKNFAQTCFA